MEAVEALNQALLIGLDGFVIYTGLYENASVTGLRADFLTPIDPRFTMPTRSRRGWYAGLSSRVAVERYLPNRRGNKESARGILGAIRLQLIAVARERQRADIFELLQQPVSERTAQASAVAHAIEVLRCWTFPTRRCRPGSH